MADSVGRVFAVIAPFLTGYLIQHYNVNLPIYVSAVFFGLGAILMISLPIETKGRNIR